MAKQPSKRAGAKRAAKKKTTKAKLANVNKVTKSARGKGRRKANNADVATDAALPESAGVAAPEVTSAENADTSNSAQVSKSNRAKRGKKANKKASCQQICPKCSKSRLVSSQCGNNFCRKCCIKSTNPCSHHMKELNLLASATMQPEAKRLRIVKGSFHEESFGHFGDTAVLFCLSDLLRSTSGEAVLSDMLESKKRSLRHQMKSARRRRANCTELKKEDDLPKRAKCPARKERWKSLLGQWMM